MLTHSSGGLEYKMDFVHFPIWLLNYRSGSIYVRLQKSLTFLAIKTSFVHKVNLKKAPLHERDRGQKTLTTISLMVTTIHTHIYNKIV